MLANQANLYFVTLLPFMMEEQVAGILLACFLGYILMFEVLTVLVARSSL
jgi:hypothetical protein